MKIRFVLLISPHL